MILRIFYTILVRVRTLRVERSFSALNKIKNVLRLSRKTIELTNVGESEDGIRYKYRFGINEFALTKTRKGKL